MVRMYISIQLYAVYIYTIIYYICILITLQEEFKDLTFMVTFAFDAFILSAGKTRPHNSAYYILQLSAWLLQRVACSWGQSNVLNQQTNKTKSKIGRHSNVRIPSNTLFSILAKLLESPLTVQAVFAQATAIGKEFRGAMCTLCCFRFDQMSEQYIPHRKYIHIFLLHMVPCWDSWCDTIPGAQNGTVSKSE